MSSSRVVSIAQLSSMGALEIEDAIIHAQALYLGGQSNSGVSVKVCRK
jgi:hypothetical protein